MTGYARLKAESALAELERDLSFTGLDPRSQREARASLLQYLYQSDPSYASDAEAGAVFQEALARSPVVNGKLFETKTFVPESAVIKQGGKFLSGINPLEVAGQVLSGLRDERTRPEAIKAARGFLTNTKASEDNFAMQLAAKSYDFLAEMFGDKREYYKASYGKEATTAAALIEDALRQYSPGDADEALGKGSFIGGVNRFVAEAGVSIASAQGGLGLYAAKGMTALLGAKGASAAQIALGSKIVEETAEGLGFGLYNVARELTKEKLGGGSLGTKWDERVGKVAAAFGAGVAMDVAVGLVLGLAKGGLLLGKGIYRKQATGLEGLVSSIAGEQDLEVASRLIKEGLEITDVSPGIFQSIPEGEYKRHLQGVQDLAKVLDRVKDVDPTSFDGARVLAFGSGFYLDPSKNGLKATSILDPSVAKDGFSSEYKALKWISRQWDKANQAPTEAVKTAQGAARAGTSENFLTIETQGYMRPEDLSSREASKLLVPTSNGAVDARNVNAFARWWLKGAGANEAQIAAFTVKQGPKGEVLENGLLIPKVLGTGDAEIAYLSSLRESLETYADKLGLKGSDPTRSDGLLKLLEKPELDTLRPRTLEYLTKEYLGGSLAVSKEGVSLKFADGTVLKYPTLEAANGAVFKNLILAGSIDESEVSRLLKETYGYNLRKETVSIGGVPTEQYRVLSDSNRLIAQGFSLPELFEARPDIVPKLPNRLAPELLFVDDTLTTLQTARRAAAGSTKTLKELIGDFKSGWVPGRKVSSAAGGSLYLSASGKQVFVLETPFGTRRKYINPSRAIKDLQRSTLNWDNLNREAASRGLRTFPVADKAGGFLITDGKGISFRARTLTEGADFIRKQPRPDDFPNPLGIKDALADELEDDYLDTLRRQGGHKILDKGDIWWEDGILYQKGPKGTTATPKGDFLLPQVAGVVFPAEAEFAKYAKKTGRTEVLESYRLMENARNITDIGIRKVKAIAMTALSDSRGRLLSGKKLGFVSELLSLPEDRWGAFAKETDRVLDTEIYRAATLTRQAYETLGKKFGIDSSRWLREYLPQLQEVIAGGQYTPTLQGLKDASHSIWGKNIPKEITFFSMNFRNGLILDSLMGEKNAYNLLMAYGVQGTKSLYIGPLWENLWEATESLKAAGKDGLVPPGLQNRWEAYLEDVAGFHPVGFDRMYQSVSLGFTRKIAQIEEAFLKKASKVPLVGKLAQDTLEEGAYKGVVTSDILGKLSNQMTINTQGWRPFVALRNTLDIQRAGAVLGNTLVVDSLKEVLEEPEYIGKLLKEGVIEDTLFNITATEDLARSRWKDLATRGLLGSDLVTRAATAKAVDKAFEVGVKNVSGGKWTWKQFFAKTGLETLTFDAQENIAALVAKGDIGGARFIAQKGMVDATMFTFRSGVGNLLTRHVMGKVFGKFQNYSFGMIDLYRRLLSSGSFGSRALKTAKMAGNALAVYYAAQAIGIDYDGFLPADAIGVSGGPYWRAAYAALEVGKKGYAGQRARSELLRTFLITAYPEPVARALTEGLDLAAQGRSRDAFLRLALGAPVKKDF